MTNLRLGTKFTLILLFVFVAGVLIGGLVLWQVLQRNAQAEVTTRGLILIETMNAVRRYTSNNVNPQLADDLTIEPEFIAETVPGYSAREVFENFRKSEGYESFLYKEATLNPTNLRDKADAFETNLVEQMRQTANPDEISGYRRMAGEDVFFIARPLKIASEDCLVCHSTPEAAPASLITTYGSDNGFGWQLNEIVAAQIIYVPAGEVFSTALSSFGIVMAIYVLIFGLVILSINYLLRRYVISPVGVVGGVAQKISTDQVESTDIESTELIQVTHRADELGYLAKVFQTMAREVFARTQKLKQQVQNLRIEIDEIRRKQEVEQVVETDFFKDLQTKAGEMRRQRKSKSDSGDDELPNPA